MTLSNSNVYLLSFCRYVVGIVFCVSFLGKMRERESFFTSVKNFNILPQSWTKRVSWLFLLVELTITICMLIGGFLLPVGFILTIALLTVFSIAIIVVLRRKQMLMCNCFGNSLNYVSIYDVIRNVVFILCGLIGSILVIVMKDSLYGLDLNQITFTGLFSISFFLIFTNLSKIAELYTEFPDGQ